MDERIRAKLEAGMLREQATADWFEETLQEFMESAGLRCERNPETNGKTPDFLVWHGNSRLYIEAAFAQGPSAFEDKRGEVDLCQLISPDLLKMGLRVILGYEVGLYGARDYSKAEPLVNPLSRRDAQSVFSQIQKITLGGSTDDEWSGTIEVAGRKLSAFVGQSAGESSSEHIGHSACALGFMKRDSRGGSVEEMHTKQRRRIQRKSDKYKPDKLDGHPLVVAVYDEEMYADLLTTGVAYGTTYSRLYLNSETGESLGADTVLMQDGIWRDGYGEHVRHLAGIWMFRSMQTAVNLPFLALNPFLEVEELRRLVPARMFELSRVCHPRPDGGLYT